MSWIKLFDKNADHVVIRIFKIKVSMQLFVYFWYLYNDDYIIFQFKRIEGQRKTLIIKIFIKSSWLSSAVNFGLDDECEISIAWNSRRNGYKLFKNIAQFNKLKLLLSIIDAFIVHLILIVRSNSDWLLRFAGF